MGAFQAVTLVDLVFQLGRRRRVRNADFLRVDLHAAVWENVKHVWRFNQSAHHPFELIRVRPGRAGVEHNGFLIQTQRENPVTLVASGSYADLNPLFLGTGRCHSAKLDSRVERWRVMCLSQEPWLKGYAELAARSSQRNRQFFLKNPKARGFARPQLGRMTEEVSLAGGLKTPATRQSPD